MDQNKKADTTQVIVTALGHDTSPSYNMLSKPAEELFRSLKKELINRYPKADQDAKRKLRDQNGCLDKLRAFFMQVHRMKKYHDALFEMAEKFNHYGNIELPITPSMAKASTEECADFESLLLQGRATLDRLTWHISDLCKQRSSSFPRLKNILTRAKYPKAAQILHFVEQTENLTYSLVEPGNPDTLRDFVAHKASLGEVIGNCFTIHYLGKNLVLVCDCEAGLPLFETSHKIANNLAYMVLNTLAIVNDITPVERTLFDLNWRLSTIVFSRFTDKLGSGHTLPVLMNLAPGSFDMGLRPVKPEIFSYAIQVKPGLDHFAYDVGKPA